MKTKEDSIKLGQVEDKIRQCENQYIATYTGFLDAHVQSIARDMMKHISARDTTISFYGGYADAERCVLLCLPDYEILENVNPLTVIRAKTTAGGRVLSHRDYLGSLTGLGISREKIGDILVDDGKADIIVLEEMAEYILNQWGKAGRTELLLEKISIGQLEIPSRQKQIVRDTVASLRLDNIVSSAFGISRSKAVEAISKGLVFVNHIEVFKADFQMKEGDTVTVRKKGKANLIETGGTSRKGRLYVTYEKY